MTLAAIWFILVFVLLGGYAILDGFDLGVGALHLFARGEHERRVAMNAIGPVWDGNEVWLLTAGGALFAAFPPVYAAVFSGFYIALMLVLACLMFRAVSMEFRGKVNSARWRRAWDVAFGGSSTLLPILFGVALGNVLRGVPLEVDGTYDGTFLGLLNPYAILVGVLTLVALTMHGAAFLAFKSDGKMHERSRRAAVGLWVVFVVLFVTTSVATAVAAPSLLRGSSSPIAWAALAMLAIAMFGFPMALRRRRLSVAVLASGAIIAAMMALAAIGLFPRLLPSSTDPSASLTIYNSSSSHRTLLAMLVIALIGMPLVIGYTTLIYRAFAGKVVLTEDSY